MAVTITNEDLARIKKVIAYPSTNTVILEDTEIKALCIVPALESYFIKFPIKIKQEILISASAEVVQDFPDSFTYGVTDLRIVGKGNLMGYGTSFWDLLAYNAFFGYPRSSAGMYGVSRYNPSGLRQTRLMQLTANNSYANLGTNDCRIDYAARKIYAYSTINGKINVEWAKWSEDFSTIRFEYKEDVINLAQGHLLHHLADTTQIITPESGPQINFTELKTRGDELIEKVMEKWKDIPDIILIRQS